MESKGHDTEQVKGLKITFVNRCMIVMTCLLAVCLSFSIGDIAKKYAQTAATSSTYMELEKKADMVAEASDYLTEQARLFVETGDIRHAELYFQEINVTQRRELALEELDDLYQAAFLDDSIQTAAEDSSRLIGQETYAMKLAAVSFGMDMASLPLELREAQLKTGDTALANEAMLEKAKGILFGSGYQQEKNAIHERLLRFTEELMDESERRLNQGWTELSRALAIQRALIGVMVLLNVLCSLAIALLVVKPLKAYLNCIRERWPLAAFGAYEFRCLAKVYNDVYDERDASVQNEAMFKHKAEHDQMTGLLNRVSAEERIRALMAEPEQYGILILLDLDDLKGINDTFGHKEGDRAILGIAETLKAHFRDSDVVGRLGGDEFVIYLPGAAANSETISFSLTSLLRKLSGIAVGEGDERRVHCSIGCAIQAPSTNTFEALFQQADTALYHVKRSGKNHFAFYTCEMEQADYQFREQKLLTQQSEKKFETAELQELLNSIASFYQLMLSVNLSTNSYYLMEEVNDGVFSKVPSFGSLDAFVRLAAKPVHPDDEAAYYDNLSRKALLQAYQRGEKNVRHYFRFLHEGSYRWIEGNVIFYNNEQGDICDFTLLRWADERAHELERLWMQKILDVAVVSSFEYICLLSLDSGEYYLHGDQENTHHVPRQGSFDQVTRTIRDESIAPEERDAYYDKAKLSTIAARMRQDGSYSYQYAMPDGFRRASFHWSDKTQNQVLMTVQRLDADGQPLSED